MKKLISCVLAMALSLSLLLPVFAASDVPFADVSQRAVAKYENDFGDAFIKISHPEVPVSQRGDHGPNDTFHHADGLLDYLGNGRLGVPGVDEGANNQGDRGQSYSWAGQAWGDWMYVSTLYNGMMSTIGLMGQAGQSSMDQNVINKMLEACYRGDFFMEEADGKKPGSTLSKINTKTGEVQILMSRENGYDTQFRNSVAYHGKLYFCGSVNSLPQIVEIDPETDEFRVVYVDPSMTDIDIKDAWAQAAKKGLCPAIRGITTYKDYLVISCVGLDENPYIAVSNDPSKGFTKIASTWEVVPSAANPEGVPAELLGYPACHLSDSIYGGSIWEMIEFNGDLYVAICTGTKAMYEATGRKAYQSFALMRGECNGDIADPAAWTWTPVAGDKADGARYTFGIDPERTRAGACNMAVFQDHLYIGEYNDTEVAVMNLLFDQDLEFLADNFEQSVSLYRMDKDENMELVMGNPTQMFPESLSGLHSGFGEGRTQYENQYIWQSTVFNGKLYLGTFDETSLAYPLGQLSNGDLIGMSKSEWMLQLRTLVDLIRAMIASKLPKPTTEPVVNSLTASDSSWMEEILAADDAFRDTYGDPALLTPDQLPAVFTAETEIQSMGELYQTMLAAVAYLEQPDTLTLAQQNTYKVQFNDLYNKMLEFYEACRPCLPKEIQKICDKILNNEHLQKIVHAVRVIDDLKDAIDGFDLFVTEDGVNFHPVTRDGMGDPYNHGVRAFAVNRDPANPWLCLGTANPFYGTQIWRMEGEGLNLPPVAPDPEVKPTAEPEVKPTAEPEVKPTAEPEVKPTAEPEVKPTAEPEVKPTAEPEVKPTAEPEVKPTAEPEVKPTAEPETKPTAEPETKPTAKPTALPEVKPTTAPTAQPTAKPVVAPTAAPSAPQSGSTATGDTTNMGLWITLAVVAAAGLGGVIYYRKKNQK